MQPAIIAIIVSLAIVSWLPEAARAMKQSMFEVTAELNDAAGGAPMVLAESGGN